MIIVTFLNDGTGNEIEGNYKYVVKINDKILSSGRIKKYNRLTGWKGLLRYFVEEKCQD